jgi:hypothetical protein
MQKYLEATDTIDYYVVLETLKKYKSYEEMICHFPDIKEK